MVYFVCFLAAACRARMAPQPSPGSASRGSCLLGSDFQALPDFSGRHWHSSAQAGRQQHLALGQTLKATLPSCDLGQTRQPEACACSFGHSPWAFQRNGRSCICILALIYCVDKQIHLCDIKNLLPRLRTISLSISLLFYSYYSNLMSILEKMETLVPQSSPCQGLGYIFPSHQRIPTEGCTVIAHHAIEVFLDK